MAYGLTKSANINSAGKYFSAVDSTSLSLTTGNTVEMWIKINTQPGNGVLYSVAGNHSATNAGWIMYYYNNVYEANSWGIAMFYFDGAGGYSRVSFNLGANSGASDFATGTWVHFAISGLPSRAASTRCELTVNGTSKGHGTGADISGYNGTLGDSTENTWINVTGNNGGLDFNPSLVRIWKEERSVANIAANMCNVLGATTNLSAEWTLDNVLTDNSGNSNTLTNTGTTLFVTDTPSTCAAATNNGAGFFMMMQK